MGGDSANDAALAGRADVLTTPNSEATGRTAWAATEGNTGAATATAADGASAAMVRAATETSAVWRSINENTTAAPPVAPTAAATTTIRMVRIKLGAGAR